MNCPECGTATITFEIPPPHRSRVPGDGTTASVCPHCLTLEPGAESADGTVDLESIGEISDAIPDSPDAAVPLVLAVGLLSSYVLYRQEIEELLRAVESAGVDPLLALDRLATASNVDPAVDLERRRSQIAQLLE